VDQALSRLTERGQLIRAGRGVYLRPIASRFGTRTPSVEQAVEALATQKGRSSSRTAPPQRTPLA
jgi:predicted transcriptional regulator of viral defense system